MSKIQSEAFSIYTACFIFRKAHISVLGSIIWSKPGKYSFLRPISISITNLYIGENDGVVKYCFFFESKGLIMGPGLLKLTIHDFPRDSYGYFLRLKENLNKSKLIYSVFWSVDCKLKTAWKNIGRHV